MKTCWPILSAVMLLMSCRNVTSTAQKKRETVPPKENIRTDSRGDPLPRGALARLGTARFRSSEVYAGIALAADGKTLATTTLRGEIQIFDPASGKELTSFDARPDSSDSNVVSLSVSPDGKFLAVARETGPVQVWEAATGRLKANLSVGDHQSWTAVFSGDGSTIAAGNDDVTRPGGKVFAWDFRTGKELGPFRVMQNYSTRVSISADGKRMASWGGGDKGANMIEVWDITTKRRIREFSGQFAVHQAALTLDGKSLAARVGFSSITVWDVESGKESQKMTGPRNICLVRFARDGKTLLTATDDCIIIWDRTTGKRIRVCPAPAKAESVAFLADGRIVAASARHQALVVWEVISGKLVSPDSVHTDAIGHVGFSVDGKTIFSGDLDGNVIFWDRWTGKQSRRLVIQDEQAKMFGDWHRHNLAISSDGKNLFSCSTHSGMPQIRDVASGRILADIEDFRWSDISTCLAFSHDGSMFALANREGKACLGDTHSGQVKARFEMPTPGSYFGDPTIAFSPDASTFALGYSTYDHNTGRRGTAEVRLLNTSTGKELRTLRALQGDKPPALAFSHDSKVLAIGMPGGVQLCNVASGKKQKDLAAFKDTVTSLAYSPDGRTLVAGGRSMQGTARKYEVFIWELSSGALRARVPAHLGSIARLAFSPDGRTLASGSADTTILLWDMTGKSWRTSTASSTVKDLEQRWKDLAASDAEGAFDAMAYMLWSPKQTVAFLRENLKVTPRKPPTEAELTKLIRALDDAQFAVRDNASKNIEQAGAAAVPLLEKALRSDQPAPSLELRRRIEALLSKLKREALSAEQIRHVRAVEVLEYLDTADARALLRVLADGPPARLTREAQDVLRRLESRK